MAESKIIGVRHNAKELEMLDELAGERESTGCEGHGDFYRLLLHREFNRRRGFPAPKPSDWQRSFRTATVGKKRSPEMIKRMKAGQKKRRLAERKAKK